MKTKTLKRTLMPLFFGLAAAAAAQPDLSGVEMTTRQLAPGIYVLEGAGGNLGLSVPSSTSKAAARSTA